MVTRTAITTTTTWTTTTTKTTAAHGQRSNTSGKSHSPSIPPRRRWQFSTGASLLTRKITRCESVTLAETRSAHFDSEANDRFRANRFCEKQQRRERSENEYKPLEKGKIIEFPRCVPKALYFAFLLRSTNEGTWLSGGRDGNYEHAERK